jgi:iron complex outermembrane receptor protein
VDWLRLGFQVAYTDARWTKPAVTLLGGIPATANSYANTPRWAGSLFGEVILPVPEKLGEMDVRADMFTQTDQFFSNFYYTLGPGTKFSGYTLLNLRYDWDDILGSRTSLGVYVKNALDKRYFLGGAAFGLADGVNVVMPGAPRTVGAELTYRF